MPLSSSEEEWQSLSGPGHHADISPPEDSVRKSQVVQTPTHTPTLHANCTQNLISPQQPGLHASGSKAHSRSRGMVGSRRTPEISGSARNHLCHQSPQTRNTGCLIDLPQPCQIRFHIMTKSQLTLQDRCEKHQAMTTSQAGRRHQHLLHTSTSASPAGAPN